MSRRVSNRGRKSGSGINGYMLIVLGVVAVAAAILIGSVVLRANQVELDDVTLCPSGPPPAATVVLIDATDTLSPVQRQSISNQLERLVMPGSLIQGERVQLYSVNEGQNLLKPIFDKCRPDDGTEANPVVSNPASIRARYAEEFSRPLRDTFENMTLYDDSSSTPLMRAIQASSVKGLGRWNNTARKRLIIVSDMLEFDQGRSHYTKRGFDIGTLDDPEMAKLYADLRDVQVQIWYVQRDTKNDVQGLEHIEFWDAYFSRQDGTVMRIYKVEG